jgi:adenylate cyclase
MEKDKKKLDHYLPFIIAICLIGMVQVFKGIPYLEAMEKKSYDYRMSELRGEEKETVNKDIVIVSIGDESFEAMNTQWPWPRHYYAKLIQNLVKAEAKYIVLDIQFDVNSNNEEYDLALAQAIEEAGNVILVATTGNADSRSQSLGGASIIKSIPEIQDAALSYGLGAINIDDDGIFRRYMIAFESQSEGGLVPTLAVEVFRQLKGVDKNEAITYHENEGYYKLGEHKIQFNRRDHNTFLINYKGGKKTYQYYKFESVVDDEDFDIGENFDIDAFDDPGDASLSIPPGILHSGVLKDKIVFVGATLFDLHDVFATPFLVQDSSSVQTPGVEIHANALQTLLDNNQYNYAADWVNFLIALLLGLIVLFFTNKFKILTSILLTILLVGLYTFVNIMAYLDHLVLEYINPNLSVFFVFTGNYVFKYLGSQKEKAIIKGAFAHYVPEKVVEALLNNPSLLQLGGEEREMTVMFSDVAGFTTISEKLSPKELVALLNEYLTAMTDIVLLNEGIIDKYEGDAIMAEWGAPIWSFDHAFKAVHSSILMQRKLTEMRESFALRGLPPLTARIGINTGSMVVGNMGSRDVFDYTVMGDNVNLASRLEGANKPYSTDIMISEATYDQVKQKVRCRELDYIRVKGKTEPIRVYEVINHLRDSFSPEQEEMVSEFVKGLEIYREGDFKTALSSFEKSLKLNSEDGPSILFKKRCDYFIKNPPEMDKWDGVFTMTTK